MTFFGFQRSLRLECFYGIGCLGEYAVADVAILKVVLVFGVRKGYFPSLATEDLDLVKPPGGGNGDCRCYRERTEGWPRKVPITLRFM